MNRADRRSRAFRRAPLLVEFGPDDLDGTVDGLWIELSRLSVGDLRQLVGMADKVKEGSDQEVDVLAAKIGEVLIDWNWCNPRTGDPVDPRSPGAVDTLDGDVLMALVDKLQGEVEGVDPDLGKESRHSPDSRVSSTSPAPIPVTGSPGLSAALANLPTHNASSAFSATSPDTPTRP